MTDITTTNRETFTIEEHRDLARLLYKRFGRNARAADPRLRVDRDHHRLHRAGVVSRHDQPRRGLRRALHRCLCRFQGRRGTDKDRWLKRLIEWETGEATTP